MEPTIESLQLQIQTLTDQLTLKDKEIERLEIDNAGLRSANKAAAADVLELTRALESQRAG